ncbi:MAG: hypothetical protein COU06_01050 [Candidatus Harrisonbacteria bacterium CG10_big_fil_rev_8_21_14_0_10_38_8]|uniref:Uncharacterized protein n=1 Tax=Candidatus Harrisonbacteria bacterium CG10_big_fil_rev_8_21_14_0_10_38_8 TaxID=1974582 RepID=A0A2M6WKD8_9BACT|nr:MAG: hypothetical protein COU06_01050 [Candidatus Harrisonbacteria bacterium CG10_big_fil_rev_8_21_14_0_10_38_8]
MKNIEHVWTILCDKSVIDKETNNISLFNLIETLTLNPEKKQFKSLSVDVNLQLVTRIKRPLGVTKGIKNIYIKVDFLSPKKESKLSFEKEFTISQKDITNLRIVNNIKNIIVEKEGEYEFVVSVKEIRNEDYEKIGRYPLSIVISKN